MARIGIVRKSKKEQRLDAELAGIIEEFARAMWNADRAYIATQIAGCAPRFTPNMYQAWNKYVDFCDRTTRESF